jgi:hypothetical protein
LVKIEQSFRRIANKNIKLTKIGKRKKGKKIHYNFNGDNSIKRGFRCMADVNHPFSTGLNLEVSWM